jgi:hypothetical protein
MRPAKCLQREWDWNWVAPEVTSESTVATKTLWRLSAQQVGGKLLCRALRAPFTQPGYSLGTGPRVDEPDRRLRMASQREDSWHFKEPLRMPPSKTAARARPASVNMGSGRLLTFHETLRPSIT